MSTPLDGGVPRPPRRDARVRSNNASEIVPVASVAPRSGLTGWFDRAVEAVSPQIGLRRREAREKLSATFDSGGASQGSFMGGQTAHDGASYYRRAMRDWRPGSSRNPDNEVLLERAELVARSRSAYRNQPIARSAVNTLVTSVVGSGLEMHCRIDHEFLGLSDDEAAAWQKNTQRLFRAWADSTDADSRRTHTFYRLQGIAYRCFKHSGEIFALLPLIPRKGTICDLRLQLVEGDRVSTPYNMINGPLTGKPKADGRPVYLAGSLWDGVETGSWGEPVAYHVETTIPMPFMEIARTWKRVLAYGATSGRRQVVHLMEEDRPGQRRGIPWLSPILEPLKQIARYSEAELDAAVLSAMFTVFVKKADADSDPLEGLGTSGPDDGSGWRDQEPGLRSGAIIDLNPGEDISMADPGRPNQAFGPFMNEILREIGMGLNIPYEILTKQFTASYSASRAAILMAWEFFLSERNLFTSEFLQPIYAEWLAQMIASGRISAPGFFDSTEIERAYIRTKWYGPVAPQLDPVKEANAMKMRMDSMVTTLAYETETYNGGDWEENITQRSREQALINESGLAAVVPVLPSQEPVFEPAPKTLPAG